MKNILMASSAIVGAAVLVASPAAAQELTFSAFQNFTASAGDADVDSSDRSFGFATNTEIHVNASMMADNGITFGFRVEIEADAGNTNNVDENTIFASGGFGKLEFGNNDGAEDSFMINGSSNGAQFGSMGNPTGTFLTTAFQGQARTSSDFRGGVDSSDATKITYTTPNFNGFSVGLSYTPDTEFDGGGTGFNENNEEGAHDHFGLGIGYDGEFNGVGLELGIVGSYGTADGEPEDDVYGIGGGIAISFGGFTIATGIAWDDMGDGTVGNDDDTGTGWGWDGGIGYAAGPWEFTVNALYSEHNDTDDELMAASAGAAYNLAPGVSVFVTGYAGEEDLGTGDENEILAVTSGLRVSF
ncbi:MAG: porin [Kiloniellaceae bacterium]|nr:porin [Kiloniellaceae bacterium]